MNILILKNYKPRVNDANKLNTSPATPEVQDAKPRLNYNVISKQFATGFEPEIITPAKMQQEPVKKLGIGYAKLGFGNYTMPLAELYLANKRSKTFNHGIGLKHLSSMGQLKNTGLSGFSDNNADAWGKYFVGKLILDANVNYSRNMVRYYGFSRPDSVDVKTTDYKNLLQNVEASVGLSESKPDSRSLFDGARVTYNFYNTSRPALENNVRIDGGLKYLFKPESSKNNEFVSRQYIRLGLFADYFQLAANPIGVSKSNTLFGAYPRFQYQAETWDLDLGGSIVWDAGTNATICHIYPQAKFSLSLVDNLLGIFVGAKGGLQRNGLKYLSNQNPFYAVYSDTASFNLSTNTSTTYDAFGGLKGKFSNNSTFKIEVHGQGVRGLTMFVNNYTSGNGNQFNVIYDNGTIINPHLEAAFQQKEKLSVFFKFDYFHYMMQNEVKAWHRPNVNATLSGNYNISDKFIIKLDVYYISRQFARTFDTAGVIVPVRLKGLADINLGLEYRFNKKFSAFAACNNIAAYRYQRWNQYPTQRFNFMIGLTANF